MSLANTDPSSGDTITNIQRELNALSSFTGKAINVAKDTIPAWTYSGIGASGNDMFDRLDAVSSSYHPTTGHTHDGTAGNGVPISAGDLADYNNLYGMVQRVNYSDVTDVTGTSFDFSSVFTGKTPGGSYSTVGVFAIGSFRQNIVRIRYKDQPVTDIDGFEIYGRFDVTGTEPSYVWTIDFFVMDPDAGETAADIGTLDASQYGVDLYFMEVFDSSDRITIPETLTNLIPLGGTGGAGGGMPITDSFTGTSISPTSAARQVWRYTGASAQTIATIDNVAIEDGGEIEITGTSDTNTITLEHNDVSQGWILNGTWVGVKYSKILLRWDETFLRYVEVYRNGL